MFSNIEKNESVPLTLLFIYSFLSGLSLILFEITANTVFLLNYSITTLPYVYIFSSLISLIVGFFYLKLEKIVRLDRFLITIMFFILSIMFIFSLSFNFFRDSFFVISLIIFKTILWVLVGMVFDILSKVIFNIRSSKKLFSILALGEILAIFIGGVSISLLIGSIDISWLLYLASIFMIFSIYFLYFIIKKHSDKFTNKLVDSESSKVAFGFYDIKKSKYLLSFFIILVTSLIIFYSIEYLFYYEIDKNITTEAELLEFFGIFFAILGLLNFLTLSFLSNEVLSRFGITFGLLIIPIIDILGASYLYLSLVFGLGVTLITIVTIKILHMVINRSFFKPTFKIIYHPIPINQRREISVFKKMIVEPLTLGLSGFLLLLISYLDGYNTIIFIILLLATILIATGVFLKKEYINILKKMLNKKDNFKTDNVLKEVDINFFLKNLKSKKDLDVIYSLNYLYKLDYDKLDEVVRGLIFHKSEIVRLEVLDTIEKLNQCHFDSFIKPLIAKEKNVNVLSKMILLYAKFSEGESLEFVLDYTKHPNQKIREASLVSLLKYGGIDGIGVAGESLNALFHSKNINNRILFLNILNRVGILSFFNSLKELLNSNNKELKDLAIKSVGNLKIKRLVPYLFDNLYILEFQKSAFNSIIKFENDIYIEVVKEIESVEIFSHKVILLRVLGRLNSNRAYSYLLKELDSPKYRDSIFEILFKSNFILENRDKIYSILESNIKDIIWLLKVINKINFANYSNSYLVIMEIKNRKIDNIFSILGFFYSSKSLLEARLNYRSSIPENSALAIEFIDNLVYSKLKKLILPILDEIPNSKKILYYPKDFDSRSHKKDSFFDYILSGEYVDDILLISLVYEIGLNKEVEYLEKLEKLLENSNPMVVEVAKWSIIKLRVKES